MSMIMIAYENITYVSQTCLEKNSFSLAYVIMIEVRSPLKSRHSNN